MTLENTLTKSLSEWRPRERDTLLVADQESPWTVQVTADRCESLGARLWELTVNRGGTPAEVRVADWARALAARSAGLPEPLQVLEIDEQAQQAVLRSETPTEADGKVNYFEVLVKGTTAATLRRFQAGRDGTRREQVAFVLTHEVLARAASTLTAQS